MVIVGIHCRTVGVLSETVGVLSEYFTVYCRSIVYCWSTARNCCRTVGPWLSPYVPYMTYRVQGE